MLDDFIQVFYRTLRDQTLSLSLQVLRERGSQLGNHEMTSKGLYGVRELRSPHARVVGRVF